MHKMDSKKKLIQILSAFLILSMLIASNHCAFEEAFQFTTTFWTGFHKPAHLNNHVGSTVPHTHTKHSDSSHDHSSEKESSSSHQHGQPHSLGVFNLEKSASILFKLQCIFLSFIIISPRYAVAPMYMLLSKICLRTEEYLRLLRELVCTLRFAPQAPPSFF